MLTVSGCADTTIDTSKKIEPPGNKLVPIQGRWIIESKIFGEQDSYASEDNTWVGIEAQFSSESVVLGDSFWSNLKYKTKRVDAEEYFMYNNWEYIKKLGFDDNEIFVLTVFSDEKFLYEIVLINDHEALMIIDGELFYIKKLSDETAIQLKIDDKGSNETGPYARYAENDDLQLRSGVLLGMRTPVRSMTDMRTEDPDEYSYRTFWIASENRQLHPVLISGGIFLPRKNGFWRLESRRVSYDSWTEDLLNARSVSDMSEKVANRKNMHTDTKTNREGILKRTILYVGNDYVSIDVTGRWKYKSTKEEWRENRLQTISIDNIQSDMGVKISEAVGKDGMSAMKSAVTKAFGHLGIMGISEQDAVRGGESFALFREMGHWYIKGRINYTRGRENPFFDFKINIIPPTELVAYDTLHLTWTGIKDMIPQAIDAFTSPNKDIIIIQTRSELLIYSLKQNGLSEKPLTKVKLNNGETVVMAEWATGNYVEKWENAYLKNIIVNKATTLSN
jgi:hypothetical protein